jgi:hypothetical protein
VATAKIHVYFFSSANTLSEYIWSGNQWQGGSTCTKCIDVFRFPVMSGSKALYAVSSGDETNSTAAIRVGFVNASSPTTLTEAIWNPPANWSLAGLQECGEPNPMQRQQYVC